MVEGNMENPEDLQLGSVIMSYLCYIFVFIVKLSVTIISYYRKKKMV